MGGHSDISAGAVAASKEHIELIWKTGINFGGNLSDFTVWMLERSLKTLNLRVKEQTKNAQILAEYFGRTFNDKSSILSRAKKSSTAYNSSNSNAWFWCYDVF